MTTIDYYFTPLSPFTYLAGMGLEEVAARHGAEIAYKPFNLGELGKETGFVPPPQRHPSRQRYRLQELRRIAAENGLTINLQPAHWPTNPIPASTAILAAREAGGGDLGRLVHGLLAASWAQEKDIADEEVIGDCLEAAGFDRPLAGAGMLRGVETLERLTNEALEAGVFGSPTYVVGEEVFWGQDRLAALDRHLAG